MIIRLYYITQGAEGKGFVRSGNRSLRATRTGMDSEYGEFVIFAESENNERTQ